MGWACRTPCAKFAGEPGRMPQARQILKQKFLDGRPRRQTASSCFFRRLVQDEALRQGRPFDTIRHRRIRTFGCEGVRDASRVQMKLLLAVLLLVLSAGGVETSRAQSSLNPGFAEGDAAYEPKARAGREIWFFATADNDRF